MAKLQTAESLVAEYFFTFESIKSNNYTKSFLLLADLILALTFFCF